MIKIRILSYSDFVIFKSENNTHSLKHIVDTKGSPFQTQS